MTQAPTFAVVIPTYNEEVNIRRLLDSFRRQTSSNWSIVVVDQSSTDRTAEIARSYGCTVIEIPKSPFYTPPARSRNVGAKAIDGEILLHLDADMELSSPDFLNRLGKLIDSSHHAAVIPESDVASGFWARCKALERSCYRGSEMEAARAVTHELFERVGGYDEDISSGEDFFITRLYEQRTQLSRDDSLVLHHHVGRSSLGAMLRKKVAYGRTAGTYLTKARRVGAKSGPSIVSISMRAYLRNWRLLSQQPAHYLGIFLLRGMELVSIRIGMWQGPRDPTSANQPEATRSPQQENR